MIYTYGDSFTYGDCEEVVRVEKPFPELLSSYYSTPVVNNGISGASLLDIHLRLAADLLDFKENDLVIVGKTTPDRSQVPAFGLSELEIWGRSFFSEQEYSNSHPYFKANRWIRGFPISDPELLIEVLEKYFDSLQYSIFKSTTNKQFLKEFVPLYIMYLDSIKLNTEEFYSKALYNLGLKLTKKGVRVVIWDWDMWERVGVQGNMCRCTHWNQKGHELFTDIITYFLKTRSSNLDIVLNTDKVLTSYYATVR